MPLTAVGIALVGPCVSAPGLGSNVSNWLGPPAIQRRMHCFLAARAWSACRVSRSNRPRPASAAAPARRKPRRLTAPSGPTRTVTQVCGCMGGSVLGRRSLAFLHALEDDQGLFRVGLRGKLRGALAAALRETDLQRVLLQCVDAHHRLPVLGGDV